MDELIIQRIAAALSHNTYEQKKHEKKINNSYVLRWGLSRSEWFDSLKPFLYYFNRRFTLYLKNNLGQLCSWYVCELTVVGLTEWLCCGSGCCCCCMCWCRRPTAVAAAAAARRCLLPRRIRLFLCIFIFVYQNKSQKWKCEYVRTYWVKWMTWGIYQRARASYRLSHT